MHDLKSGGYCSHKMQSEDFFLERLKLLIVMSRAFINGYPIDSFRREAVLNNAEQLVFEVTDWNGRYTNIRGSSSYLLGVKPDNFFYQRVKLLSLMCKSFAEGNPAGHFRMKALRETIEHIENVLRIKEIDIPDFKVA